MADRYERKYVAELGKHVEVIRYGVCGPPILVFPPGTESAWHFEEQGMPGECGELLHQQRLQFFVVTGYTEESWFNRQLSPRERVLHYLAYEHYVCAVIAKRVIEIAANPRLGAVGFGYGGYTALSLALKHPELCKTGISIMGLFDLSAHVDGYYDEDFYFCNPVDYVVNLTDQYFLQHFNSTTRLVMVSGEYDRYLNHNHRLHKTLTERNIPHRFEVWGVPTTNEPYWHTKQLAWILDILY